MKTPAALRPVIDDGVIDEVIRSLKSGKEATVYLVRAWAHMRCAKVYRDMRQRSFQKRAAGVRVPKPYGYFNDALIMELVTDAAGDPAPRLGEVDLPAETTREFHRLLVQQIVRMLSVGLIHGDLSEFNVLVGPDGPGIIDLPQAVNAAASNGALAMLERNVHNIRGTLRPR